MFVNQKKQGSSRFGRKAKGSMGFPVLLDSTPLLGLVSSYYWTLLFSFAFLLPFLLPPVDQLCDFFFLTDLGFIFLYIFYFFVAGWAFFFFFFFFFFFWHYLKQIKPLFGSIVQVEVCKNSDFFFKLIFYYFNMLEAEIKKIKNIILIC